MENKKLLGTMTTMVSAVYFGFMPLITVNAYEAGATSLMVSTLRFAIATPIVFIVLKIQHVNIRITPVQFRDIAILTIFGMAGTAALLFTSYTFLNTGTATTIHFMYPALTILGCAVFLKEKIQPLKMICVIMCAAGVLLFYNGGGDNSGIGIAIAMASSVTYSFYCIYLQNSSAGKIPALLMIFYLNIIATVSLGTLAAVTGNFTLEIETGGWIACAILSVFSTFVGVYGFTLGVKYIGAQNSTILSTLEPVTSIIVGAIAYNEGFTFKTVLGSVLILSTTVIIARAEGFRKQVKDEADER